ncbi:NAD-dependent epimerase/dehydratase family protein [Roseiconus nitratireducens]|uniref:NAD-dependent epimerase/dehydratase family protein n=1 Tax=Roseiconus nitratireducens TaxID=2605748 RepID=A0A5M6DEL6_9BACT|nr:NAD-dependent epimerase/dehydratase family protein [Roseiconus nitratireducens]KAA5543635.1 NAD-dependent epimerase/dehydratase family protein [Roseiconus nitratireducens]
MKRIFLTGATGFVGRHLASHLAGLDCEVVCLVRDRKRATHLYRSGFELIEGDLQKRATYEDALRDCDVVFHVAGLTHALRARQLFEVNCDATERLARACMRMTLLRRFVFVSSLAAVGPASRVGQPVDEETVPAPVSDYGRSKLAGENSLREFAKDLPTTIVRPGIVFGPHDAVALPMHQMIAKTGVHITIGFRTPPLAMVYVDDLVKLLIASTTGECLSSDPADVGLGVYMACDDREFPTYGQLGRRIATAQNRRVIVWPLWRWVGRTVAWGSEQVGKLKGRPQFLSSDKAREAVVRSWECSSEKARSQLGFAASQSLQERIEQTVRWYRENGQL